MSFQEIIHQPATVFIDVRSPLEYKAGHYPGARNMPLNEIREHIAELKNLGVPLVFYCRSGARSGSAVELLNQLGIPGIYNGGAIDELLYLTQKQMN